MVRHLTQNTSTKGPAICSTCLSSARSSSLPRFSQEEPIALASGTAPAQGQMEDAHSLGKSHSGTTALSKIPLQSLSKYTLCCVLDLKCTLEAQVLA